MQAKKKNYIENGNASFLYRVLSCKLVYIEKHDREYRVIDFDMHTISLHFRRV